MSAKKLKKKKKKHHKKWFKIILFLILGGVLLCVYYNKFSSSPVDYYRAADNSVGGAVLKTKMHHIIRKHTYLDFEENTTARYWWDNYFRKTDWHPNGYYWDMYSSDKNNRYINGSVQSREHCLPRSWWGFRKSYSKYHANGDLHNLFPSNSKANSAKSNLPLGEVGIAQFDNGVSKVGLNTFPNGYRGQSFEPSDEYKGDFARVYFYMVTCYQDYAENWRQDATKSMLANNSYPTFQQWSIAMLLKWHRDDPVSPKEEIRNNEVYKIQGNRNPFIDYPDLAEYIWGNKRDSIFVSGNKVMYSPPVDWIIGDVEKETIAFIDRIRRIVKL